MGARIDCWHTHTELREVTDVGLIAFITALISNRNITTVDLGSKYECLACSHECVHAMLCIRFVFGCIDVVVCGVFMWKVSDEWMLAPYCTSRLLGRGCSVCGAPRGGLHCLMSPRKTLETFLHT